MLPCKPTLQNHMPSNSSINVILTDDHKVVRRGLRTFLESFSDVSIVATASNGEEAIRRVENLLPDVVIVDLLMPGGMDGIQTLKKIREIAPNTQVVVLTASTDDSRVVAALRAGAIGYIRKDADPELLLEAVRAAARGRSVLDPEVATTVLQELAVGIENDLTEREMEVLRQLAHGRTNKQIAAALTIGEETVKTHVGNILTKFQLAHRTQAVVYALKQGLISLDEVDL